MKPTLQPHPRSRRREEADRPSIHSLLPKNLPPIERSHLQNPPSVVSLNLREILRPSADFSVRNFSIPQPSPPSRVGTRGETPRELAGEDACGTPRSPSVRASRFVRLLTSAATVLLLSILPVLSQTNPPAAPLPATGTLSFFNGDLLQGQLLRVTGDPRVQWQNADLGGALDFSAANLHKLTLTQPTAAPRDTTNQFLVRLHNGDELIGRLLALDADKLVLDTWFGGQLTIQRPAVRSLRPLGGNRVVYEGPTGLDGWRPSAFNFGRGTGGFQFKNGAFVSSGPSAISRDLNLPASMRLEFDLQWQGTLQLMMTVFSESLQPWGGDGYQFLFNQYNFSLTRLARDGNQAQLGSVQVLGMNTRNKAHLALHVDKAARTFTLAVDGETVQTWKDAAEFSGKGTGLVFFQQGQFNTKISKIRVSEWDGKNESSGSTTNRPTEDMLELINRDKVNGKLAGIRDGKAAFSTGFASMEIPLARVQFVELTAPAVTATNAPAANDVRLFFADRGSLTLALAGWDQKQVRGRSPAFGDATFTTAAFNQIQFNLARDRKPEADSFDAREP